MVIITIIENKSTAGKTEHSGKERVIFSKLLVALEMKMIT